MPTLDLHGMTLDEAFAASLSFIEESRAAKIRDIRIITGKGNPARGTGEIREKFPIWLENPIIAEQILTASLDTFGGAFEIKLKK